MQGLSKLSLQFPLWINTHTFKDSTTALLDEQICNTDSGLSCTFRCLLMRGGRGAMPGSRERRREEGSEVWGWKWFTVLYLDQSVCQSSALLQHSQGNDGEGGKKEMKRKWKTLGHLRGKTPRKSRRKFKINAERGLRDEQSTETDIEMQTRGTLCFIEEIIENRLLTTWRLSRGKNTGSDSINHTHKHT